MVKREELLELLSRNSEKDLINFILQCRQDGRSCLSDIISSCSRKQLSHIWEKTYTLVKDQLLMFAQGNVEDTDDVSLIQCLILLMMAMISQKDVYVCEPMFQTASILKDCLVVLPPTKDPLKNALSKLYEEWWHKNLYGRQHLISTAFMYILDKSVDLKNKEVAAVVNRVWGLHEMVPLIDLHAEESHDFRELLNKCFICHQYIRNDQGIKFLAYILTEDQAFTKTLHWIIKKHLIHSPKLWHEKYGEMYFRAWQQLYKNGGQKLLDFEQDCIQDLMSMGIRAQTVIAPAVRRILGYLHRQKKQRGVDEMLCRLYEPLIWRMLKVPNQQVRENAARLFFDVFPVQNPDLSKEDSQQLLQKQFDLFTFLMNDPAPSVRCVAVVGVFRAMRDYWELLSEDLLKNLTKTMINDMRFDGTSKGVRESVIRGFICLLDNPLSHMFLKSVLPKVQGSFHDVAVTVRIAMIELLIKVKTIRGIRYWDIVSLEHLLARLVCDEDPVRRRIVELLFDNFVPIRQSVDVQIERIVYMIEHNRAASREFFRLAVGHVNIKDTVDLIVTICKAVLIAVKKTWTSTDSMENSSDQINSDLDEMNVGAENGDLATNANSRADNKDTSDDDDDVDNEDYYNKLTVDNSSLMLGLLESIFILWTLIRPELTKPSNSDFKKYLDKRLSVAIIEMEKVFKDPEIVSVLLRLMGYLPASYMSTLNRTWLPKLRSMTSENIAEDFDDLLVSLCEINRASDIFELVIDWLKPSLEKKTEEPSSKQAKKSRRVRIVDPVEAKPLLGIKILRFMLMDKMINGIVLENQQEDLLMLKNLLRKSMRRLQEHLETVDCERDQKDGEIFLSSFTLYFKILLHLHSENESVYQCLEEVLEVISWVENDILPLACVQLERQGHTADDRKDSEKELSLPDRILEGLLEFLSGLFMCGAADERLATKAVELCAVILVKDAELQFLPQVLHCLCQDVEFVKFSSDDRVSGCLNNILPNFCTKLLVSLSTHLKNNVDSGAKMLCTIKANMTDLTKFLFASHTFTESFMEKITNTVLAAVMAEMSYSSQNYDLDEDTDQSTLPNLSRWLLDIICKRPVSLKLFIKNLKEYGCQSAAVTQVHSVHSVVHLMGAMQKYKSDQEELKQLWDSLGVTVDNLISNMDKRELDSQQDIVMSIRKKMDACKDRFVEPVS